MMLFPLKFVPRESFKDGPRKFKAQRRGGRLHAGCDLYAPVGTPVYAVADGIVLGDPTPFYEEVWQVTVDHGDFIARYGEVVGQFPPAIKAEARVAAGDLLGTIGYMKRLKLSMLHFEMYSGIATGPLTNNSKPFRRRSDLLDPTDALDKALRALQAELAAGTLQPAG